jgi:hypothetical protein
MFMPGLVLILIVVAAMSDILSLWLFFADRPSAELKWMLNSRICSSVLA